MTILVVVVPTRGGVDSPPPPAAARSPPPTPTLLPPLGTALATLLALSLTNTTLGLRSPAILPASAANNGDTWAVPRMCTVRVLPAQLPPPPLSCVLAHVNTNGSHSSVAEAPLLPGQQWQHPCPRSNCPHCCGWQRWRQRTGGGRVAQ